MKKIIEELKKDAEKLRQAIAESQKGREESMQALYQMSEEIENEDSEETEYQDEELIDSEEYTEYCPNCNTQRKLTYHIQSEARADYDGTPKFHETEYRYCEDCGWEQIYTGKTHEEELYDELEEY